jgi:hypothetical protein
MSVAQGHVQVLGTGSVTTGSFWRVRKVGEGQGSNLC